MRARIILLSLLILCGCTSLAVAQNTFAANGVAQAGTIPAGGSVSYTFSAPAGSNWYGTVSALTAPMSTRTVITNSAGNILVSSGTLAWGGGGQNSAADTYTITLTRTDAGSGQGSFQIVNAIIPGPPAPQADEEGGPIINEAPVSGSVAYGDLDIYWFTANASDPNLNVEMDYPAGASPNFSLIGPDGGISDNCGTNSQNNPTITRCYFYNNLAGTIYALVSPNSATPRSYTLTLHNSTAAPAGQNGKSLGGCAACEAALVSAGSTGTVAVGDPINPSSGNVFETVVDYTTAGQNPLALVRYYNSAGNLQAASAASPFAVSLGVNWRTNYDRYLHLVSPTVTTAERPDGRILTFRYNGTAWIPDTDVDFRLTNSGNAWTLTDADDIKEAYAAISATEAQLNTITTSAGYVQYLAYNGGGQLQTVTDSYTATNTGRQFGFTYTGATLTGVTTPDTLALTYGFDTSGGKNRLKTVGYNTSPATSQTYLYENAGFPFALTGITDEKAARFATWGYDSQGRGASSQLAGGADATTVSYAADGLSAIVTGPLGLQQTYKYKTLQDQAKIVEIDRHDPGGSLPDAVETLTYDANGYLQEVLDWNGNETYYVNNAYGRPTTIYEAYGSSVARTTSISYDTTWLRKPSQVNFGNAYTNYTYDGTTGTLTRKVITDNSGYHGAYAPAALTWNYTYTATGQRHTVQAPRTDLTVTTTYGYTGGVLTSISNPLSQATTISAYTTGGRPQTVTDPNGVVTTMTYSPRNWLLTRSVATTGGARLTTYGYDAAGNLTSVQQPGGATLTNGYDNAHRLTTVTNSLNEIASYTLNAMGDVTAMTTKDAGGTTRLSRSSTFDAAGRRLTHTGGASQVTHYAYDKNGNATSITDPMGNPATAQLFDALNRVSQITDRAAGVTHLAYDAYDKPVTVTAPNGAVTSYGYDGYEQLVKYTSPDAGRYFIYSYDGDGNKTGRLDAAGLNITYAYDALDRRTKITYPTAAENVTYSYDQAGHGFGIGRLTGMTDQAGTFSRSYDERGNITADSHTYGINGTYTLANAYSYDAGGFLTGQTYPDGMILAYGRDATEQLKTIKLKPTAAGVLQNVITTTTHRPFGPLTYMVYGNGIVDTRGVDQDYRTTGVTDTGTASLQGLTYALNANDNVTGITDAVTAGNSQTLTYDALDRLHTAVGGYGSETFGYDANGNRTSLNGVANTYNANTNLLTAIGSAAVTYNANGANGNITGIAYAAPMGFTYNNANRLATVTISGGTVLSNVYDGFGQRITKTDTAQRFQAYDWMGRYVEQTDNTVTTKLDYIYLGGLPVATFVPNGGTGTLSFLHTDRLGTPRLATNASQAVGWNATAADPFGAPNAVSGNTIANDLRMPGQEYEQASGHNHNGWRDYAPALGRYLEADPTGLGGGLNTFAYAGDNPAKLIDQHGLDTFKVNRQLGGSKAMPWGPTNILSHTFVATTDSSGYVTHTYSWGSDPNHRGWNEDQPQDVSAAQAAINANVAHHVGDADTDYYVDQQYGEMDDPNLEHANGLLVNNCKTEASKLVDGGLHQEANDPSIDPTHTVTNTDIANSIAGSTGPGALPLPNQPK